MNQHVIRTTTALIALTLALTALPAFAGETGTVNVNSAGVEQLALLPRIGPAVAQRIVDYREANGAFKALEDLMLVRGIGEKTFELIKPYASLSGQDHPQCEGALQPRHRGPERGQERGRGRRQGQARRRSLGPPVDDEPRAGRRDRPAREARDLPTSSDFQTLEGAPMSAGERGMTLIELLVVMAVIGLLAALAVPPLLESTADLRVAGGGARSGVDPPARPQLRGAPQRQRRPPLLPRG